TRQLRRQLRPALRLRRGQHDALIAFLLTVGHGRRTFHLMQLVEEGLRAEESGVQALDGDARASQALLPYATADADTQLSLRITINSPPAVYRARGSSRNWPARLRELAIKGMERRPDTARGPLANTLAQTQKPAAVRKTTSHAKHLMASMMAMLNEGDE